MPSISIAFQTDKPLSAYGSLAAAAEAWGFDGVTVYNDMLYQPAWLPLLEMARATQKVRLGVAAVNPFTCHPINIAGNIALVDEASGGRAYVGIARGAWLDFVGIHPAQPVRALAEALRCVRHLLRGEHTPLPGDFFPLAGGDGLRWPSVRGDIPILLGTWGAQTMHACAGGYQEIKVGGSANPAVVPHFRNILRAAGDGADAVDICIGAVTVVDEDGDAARALARREVALYLPVVAELDPTVSIEPERLARIRDAAARYEYAAAAAAIDDELLARFAFAGTPDEVAAHALTLLEAGAQRVEFGTPHGITPGSGPPPAGRARPSRNPPPILKHQLMHGSAQSRRRAEDLKIPVVIA